MLKSHWPAVIALNGPPHSGKTTVAKKLQELIPDATILYPNLELYAALQESGKAPRGLAYHEYKKRPESRQTLIDFSREQRLREHHIWERRVTDSPAYQNSRVVIIDNVGHVENEFDFYDTRSECSLLVRLDTPYQEIEPLKSRARRLRTTWGGDSRTPLEHHTMLTAYDSRQMLLLLEWLANPKLTSEEAGPYHGIRTIWSRHFATARGESSGVLSDGRERASRQLGGLGEAVDSDPGFERVLWGAAASRTTG